MACAMLDQVWAAAHVDEDWNIEKWGVDEEVANRRAARYVDFAGRHPHSRGDEGRAEGSSVNERFTPLGLAWPRTETSAWRFPINPVLPVLPAAEAGAVAPELVLQPGTTIDATVLKVLSADLVRIAIAALSIDVKTEIPLQPGQTLKLAVSQTEDGIRLTNVTDGRTPPVSRPMP